jgi:signal transduction histidine kinase/ligand-binding sensor domain-containing protein
VRLSAVISFLLGICSAPVAQTSAQQVNLPVQHLGVGNGLPQGSIYSLHQDRRGFMWVGTGDGLARWDGRNFRSYRGRHNDSSGLNLAARTIRGSMVEDERGGLWMNTSLGVVRYDLRAERFRTIPTSEVYNVEHSSILGIDSKQRLYCQTGNNVYTIEARTNKVSRVSVDLDSVLVTLLDGDTLLLATKDGLYKQYPGSKTVQLVLRVPEINQVFRMPGGAMQVWTKKEIIVCAAGQRHYPLSKNQQNGFWVKVPVGLHDAYGVDKSGLVLYHIRTGAVERIGMGTDPKSSLSNKMINVLFLDRSGNLWCGTEGTGIDIIDTKGFKFELFPRKGDSEYPDDIMAKSILDVGGRVWVGSFDKGLFEVDRKTGEARQWKTSSATLDRVSLLFRDSDGRVWMNREDRIGIVDTVNKAFRQSTSIPNDVKGNHTAYSMLELAKNEFLLGTTYRLYKVYVRHQGIEILPIMPGHTATTGIIAALEQRPDGSIFIGKVRDGFYRISLNGTSLKVLDEGMHYTGIRDFQATPKGKKLWMATENGLALYDPEQKSTRVLDEADGLSNSHVYGIVPESDSVLWLSTNKGLNRVRIIYNTEEGIERISPRSYTDQDGLQSNEFNTGAYSRFSDGAIAFGGVRGINWFYPRQFKANLYAPFVALTGISVNEKPWKGDTAYAYLHALSLPYSSNTIAFQMAALEYTNAASNRFSYKLEGFDREWVDGGSNGEARYANLPPGNYQFLVRAANSDGVWSATPERLNITIHPPWWSTTVARITALLQLVILMVAGIRRYVRGKVAEGLRQVEKQQAVNEERLRISRDMHDELGTGLTKIALLSEVARRKATSLQPHSLSEITNTSRALTQKIGEIVWTLNPQNDTLDTLTSYIREWVQEQYDSLKDVYVRTEIDDQFPAITLSHSLRQALLLVTKEAVNNAIKYAQAKEIVVRINLTDTDINFQVIDNGRGFLEGERNKAGGGNGLKNMAARMAGAGGNFSIVSSPGKGTAIRFSIPMPKSRS